MANNNSVKEKILYSRLQNRTKPTNGIETVRLIILIATNEELIVSQNGNYYAAVSDTIVPTNFWNSNYRISTSAGWASPQEQILYARVNQYRHTSSAGNYATGSGGLRNGLLIYQANQSTITVSKTRYLQFRSNRCQWLVAIFPTI